MTTTVVRRPKWHPPPPPTPRILHLPRRATTTTTTTSTTTRRRKKHLPPTNKPISGSDPVRRRTPNGKLENLFDQERAFSYSIPPIVLLNSGDRIERRRSSRSREGSGGGGGEEEEEKEERKNVDVMEEEEKWRFQAEMLRAECKYLRMERELAVKKLEKERWILEKTLKSTVHALISGKEKIQEGENSADNVLEEEIAELAKKLTELQRNPRLIRDPELQFCGGNFDKQASMLEKQLDKLGGLSNGNYVRDIVVASSSVHDASSMDSVAEESSSSRRCSRFPDVETLKKKMEGLSKGKLLQRMEEEYGSMLLSITASRSVPGSASSSMRYELPELSSSSPFQRSLQEMKPSELKASCSGHCKAIVRRIMEQVRAETQQWSQMQEMLGQVKEEMEGLQASRDFWEHRALDSDHKIQSLQSSVQGWQQKASTLEDKDKLLQKQVKTLQLELGKLRLLQCQEVTKMKESSPLTFGELHEKEKRALACHVKASNQSSNNFSRKKDGLTDGNKIASPNRPPLQEIGNLSSPLLRQNSKRLDRAGNKTASPNRSPLQEIGNLSPLLRQNSKRVDKAGNKAASPNRPPLQEIGNFSSPLLRQNSKRVDKAGNKIASPHRSPLQEIGSLSSPLMRQNSKKLTYPMCSPHHTYSAR